MTNLILCGGSGTRLWPLSRKARPKQFVPLFGGKSLFQETVERNQGLVSRFLVAINAVQVDLARDQLQGSRIEADYLIEPMGRNTAPAIALGCLSLDPSELVLVTPSDHRITRAAEYKKAVGRAAELAEQGFLVTFGIRPTEPETGFGYIEAEGEVVQNFREKPDLATARRYLETGRYYWNSGMFVFRAGVFLQELGKTCPDVLDACRRVARPLQPTPSEMADVLSISVDYAVLEKSSQVRVVGCDLGWSDLGGFDALRDEMLESGRDFLGDQEPLILDGTGNLVVTGGRKVVLVDVDDLIVVDTNDAVLVTKRGHGQRVKDVVENLKRTDPRLLE